MCKCDKKYIGDGKSCQLAPECTADEECSENSHCFEGVCMCNEGFERDTSDLYAIYLIFWKYFYKFSK